MPSSFPLECDYSSSTALHYYCYWWLPHVQRWLISTRSTISLGDSARSGPIIGNLCWLALRRWHFFETAYNVLPCYSWRSVVKSFWWFYEFWVVISLACVSSPPKCYALIETKFMFVITARLSAVNNPELPSSFHDSSRSFIDITTAVFIKDERLYHLPQVKDLQAAPSYFRIVVLTSMEKA